MMYQYELGRLEQPGTVSRTGRDQVARRLGDLNPGMAQRYSILNRHVLLAALANYPRGIADLN